MSNAPDTIVHDGKLYIRNDIVAQHIRMLEAEIKEQNTLLHTYRQTVFVVRDTLNKLEEDQKSWLNESQ